MAPSRAPEGLGTDVELLVGTTRERVAGADYAGTGRGPIQFSSITVSIPPLHETGNVEIGGSNPDPERHFVIREIQPRSETSFRAEVARRFVENPEYEGEAFIFIHGFNNTMADGVFRAAQIAEDLGISALPVHYSWPSVGTPLGYPADRDSALFARRGLQELIETLEAAGARNIILVAHSLGSQITMETLRQMSLAGRGAAWNRIGGVALLAPDLDIDVFHSQVAEIGVLPKPFLIFVSRRDAALRLSARLTGQRRRLGNIESAADVAALDVTVIDVSQFNDAENTHLTAVSSPTLISLVNETGSMDEAFKSDTTMRTGLLPGTILTVQNATEIILDPVGVRAVAGR